MPNFNKCVLRHEEIDEAICRRRAIPLRAPHLLSALFFALCSGLFITPAQADGIQVLHWWKSDGERKAVDVLVTKLADESVTWRDGVIPSGSGVGASIVLRSRILAGDVPEVAQLNGVMITEWDRLSFLRNIDSVGVTAKWNTQLLPTVLKLIKPHGYYVAAPLGIHRVNTLFFNRKLFTQNELTPPQTWDEFERVAAKLQQLGIVPLAQSSEPWQVATLFETLVLSEGGASFYRELFVNKNAAAYSDERLARALQRLRHLKRWMNNPVPERVWADVTRQLADGGAAMMVMGDWAKGEMNAWGIATDEGFGCSAVPATEKYHLYDIDTLVMLNGDKSHWVAQDKLAKIAMSAAVQSEYNQVKGSVSVLRHPDMNNMDSCARASWKLFANDVQAQVPSLVHRMATDEITKDAIIAVVHHFFLDDGVNVAETQRRLASIARSSVKVK